MTRLRIVCTFLAYSTLPVLLSIAVLFLSPGAHGSDYWSVAPWLIVAALWVTPLWMIVVVIGLAIVVRKKGVRASTLKNENAVIFVLVAIVVGAPVAGYSITIALVNRSLDRANADEVLGARHLQANDQVSGLFTGSFYVKSDRRMADPDANGVRRIGYIVSGTENDQLVRYFALVDVAPGGSGRQAHLLCILPIDAWVNSSPTWDRQCDKVP